MKTETKRKTQVAFDFVPVIFANGEDDDLPGLTAAFRNEKVLYGERVYKPGEEIAITRRKIKITRGLYIFDEDPAFPKLLDNPDFVCVKSASGRVISIVNCQLDVSGFNIILQNKGSVYYSKEDGPWEPP